MRALIDADIVLHRVCWTTENEDLGIAKFRADEMLDGILLDTGATEFELWLSDAKENNFRYKLYPPYKANRVQPKPVHYETLKEYLITQWGARIAFGMEADDALGIEQTKNTFFLDNGTMGFGLAVPKKEGSWYYGDPSCPEGYGDSIICSIDKDLLTIPGKHWNFVKQEEKFVTPVEALRNFYAQFLIGDTADNIQGASGIGPKKAAKILNGLETEEEMFDAVVETFQRTEEDWSIEQVLQHILQIGQVLKIKQTEDEVKWHFPKSKRMTEILGSLSIQTMEVGIAPSTEPTGVETLG